MNESNTEQKRNLVQVAERYRMKPPVPAPSKRYHESRDVLRIFAEQGQDQVEACQKDLAQILERKRTYLSGQQQQNPKSIEETLGLVFAEHVSRRSRSGVSSALAKEAQQALQSMASIVAPRGGYNNTSDFYIKALGALIACYNARSRIDVDSALHYLYEQ